MPDPGPREIHYRPSWTAVVLVFALLVLAGCADRATPDFRGRPAQNQTIPVDVRNQHYADVVVRVSRGGAWQRIGEVTGNSSERLEVPSALTSPAGDYRFRVHAIGSADATDYVSERIAAYPGSVVVLTVAPVLRMSSWSIRD